MSTLQARNEAIIHAPVSRIWSIITDINQLHKVNPGILKAAGAMNQLGAIRTCDIENGGKKGTMTEKLIEMEPETRTVWTIVDDTMGMSSMLADTRFCFHLEKLGENDTKVVNETYYRPATLLARLMNRMMLKKMIGDAQARILANLQSLAER